MTWLSHNCPLIPWHIPAIKHPPSSQPARSSLGQPGQDTKTTGHHGSHHHSCWHRCCSITQNQKPSQREPCQIKHQDGAFPPPSGRLVGSSSFPKTLALLLLGGCCPGLWGGGDSCMTKLELVPWIFVRAGLSRIKNAFRRVDGVEYVYFCVVVFCISPSSSFSVIKFIYLS